MNAIRILFVQPWVGRLGSTLVHFLWQGLAIAAVYAAARASTRHWSPRGCYLLACVALTAMLVAPVATFCLLDSQPAMPISFEAAAPATNSDSGMAFPAAANESTTMSAPFAAIWSERVLPSVVMLWLAGALAFWLRLVGGWLAGARLRTQLVGTPPAEWQQAFDRLRARLRIGRPVQLLISGLVEAPIVIGWLRPAVLVPIGALAGLPTEHLEALLLHELAHIRRYDYLVNLLQSIAEALLFYHPAVWWISGHIRADRELCCDDLAVAETGDAFNYALALARLEASRPAHRQGAVAANGGRLADRIARLLGQTRPQTRMFSERGAAGALLLALTALVVFGQSTEPRRFEVASVKQSPKMMSYSTMRPQPGGRLHAENLTVRQFISSAYSLQDFQVVGGPDWIRSEGFDIEAKAGAAASWDQLMVMLQALLEDRLQLKYHRETRDVPVYALTVAKSGAKLQAPQKGACVSVINDGPLPPPPPKGGVLTPCGTIFTGFAAPAMSARGGDIGIPELIRFLSHALRRPVLDRTGIATHFDMQLNFAVDDALAGMADAGAVAGHRESMADMAKVSGDAGSVPNILTAIQQQLGLKLEVTKGPVEFMVIDHVEKPTAN